MQKQKTLLHILIQTLCTKSFTEPTPLLCPFHMRRQLRNLLRGYWQRPSPASALSQPQPETAQNTKTQLFSHVFSLPPYPITHYPLLITHLSLPISPNTAIKFLLFLGSLPGIYNVCRTALRVAPCDVATIAARELCRKAFSFLIPRLAAHAFQQKRLVAAYL